MFLECKHHATFHELPPFCLVTIGLTTTSFSKWDDNTSKMEVREDRRALLGSYIINATRDAGGRASKGCHFMLKFMGFRLPHIFNLYVWLWIMYHERMTTITDLYAVQIKYKCNIIHTCLPYKMEGMTAFSKAKGNKQKGGMSLIFLTVNKLRDRRQVIKPSHFAKLYRCRTFPNGVVTKYFVFHLPWNELQMEFYVIILEAIAKDREMGYNIF